MMLGQLSCGYTIFLKLYIPKYFWFSVQGASLALLRLLLLLATYLIFSLWFTDRVCVMKYHKTIMKTYVYWIINLYQSISNIDLVWVSTPNWPVLFWNSLFSQIVIHRAKYWKHLLISAGSAKIGRHIPCKTAWNIFNCFML